MILNKCVKFQKQQCLRKGLACKVLTGNADADADTDADADADANADAGVTT